MKVDVWDCDKHEYTTYTGVSWIANVSDSFKLQFKDKRKKTRVFDKEKYDLDFIVPEE